jgi:imidazolonepropionase
MKADWLLENVHIATMDNSVESPYGEIANGAIAIADGKISWVGSLIDLPECNVAERIDGKGQWITPGLVDCHTHLIYGGNRATEFEARLKGVSYEEIAKQGGGINSTVSATRNCSEQELYTSAAKRLNKLTEEGVTTVEIKSGYGLDLDNELKMLRVCKRLNETFPITITSTFLGAHALPPEYKNRSDEYIDLICTEMLPKIAALKLADTVDVFCEGIGFSTEQCRRVFSTAQSLGLAIKGHVEQLSYLGGAKLVAEFNGLSVDHIEYLPTADLDDLKAKGVTAVVLPAAYYYLHETQQPPIQAMRDAGVAMAIATDHNPGSSPTLSLLTTMNQAAVLFAMTPEEALTGTTRHGAQALGLGNSKGQLTVGYDADILLWDINHPAELSYGINTNRPTTIWVGGCHV